MKPLYRIVAQNLLSHQKTLVVFEKIGKYEKIIRPADEILKDKQLISNFDLKDRDLINFVVMEEEN